MDIYVPMTAGKSSDGDLHMNALSWVSDTQNVPITATLWQRIGSLSVLHLWGPAGPSGPHGGSLRKAMHGESKGVHFEDRLGPHYGPMGP